MRRLFHYSILLFFFFSSVSGQVGAPLLTHFEESRDIENQSWAICQDEDRVMLFANRKGILSFDGEEWSPLKLSVIPFAMQINPFDRKIFIGGLNYYGYIEKQQSGRYRYVSLSDSANIGLITGIIFTDSIAWFYGEKTINRYNLTSDQLEMRLNSPPGTSFSGMFLQSQNIFIQENGKDLFLLNNDTLTPFISRDPAGKKNILFTLPYDKDFVLIGFGDGTMSLFDGTRYYDYQIKDDGYVSENILSQGICIGDSLYAFSTLDGGAVVIDKIAREVRFTVNNQNGLPDDEVFAICSDRSGGLWLSHQFGLTRADLNLPLGNFSIYPGLKGNLTQSLRQNGELYVATSEGVFYLTKIKKYSEVDVLIKNDIRPVPDIRIVNRLSPMVVQPAKENPPEHQNRKKIFAKIFGKKEITVESEPVAKVAMPEITVPKIVQTPLVRYHWRKVSKLKSVEYTYRKVEGLNEKCRQLVSTNDGILAATNKGLFIIKNHKAKILIDNRYINFVSWHPVDDTYIVATGDGYFIAALKNKKWSAEITDPSFTIPVYSAIQSDENTLWLGGESYVYKGVAGRNGDKMTYRMYGIKVDFPQRCIVNSINDTVFIFTETGVHFYDSSTDHFIKYTLWDQSVPSDNDFEYPLSNIPVMKQGKNWIYADRKKQISEKDMLMFKLFDEIVSVTNEMDFLWIIDRENRLFAIDRKKASRIIPETTLFIKNIRNERGTSFDLSNIVFNRGDNIINFKIVAPVYLRQNLTQYQFYIDEIMTDWSTWTTETNHSMFIPRSGDYTLQVRARDLWGYVGDPVSLQFTIKAPFTKTTLFYLLLISSALLIILVVVHFREKQLQEKNRKLEMKVRERTAEIEAQKGEITSSIQYASRIQYAMLPMNDMFKSFSDHFIIYKPKNIVSGDFYWIGENETHIFLTVADCTGHGVPGAFMSALGISILNEIITHNANIQANTVLNLLRERIKTSLHQTGKEGEAADGMDISLCVFKKNMRSIQFSGAYNSLLIFNGGELMEYKADRMPIGIHYGNEPSFTNFEIKIKKGDLIYLLSDGLTDQFGGPDCSKFKKANLRKLLSEINLRPMSVQKEMIEAEFSLWKGNAEQVDDVTVIGVRI